MSTFKENITDIASGLRVPAQVPLDAKSIAPTETALKDLGPNDNLALTYYKGMRVTCQAEMSEWIWDESGDSKVGLMPSDFVYPTIASIEGYDYSGKAFNFFPDPCCNTSTGSTAKQDPSKGVIIPYYFDDPTDPTTEAETAKLISLMQAYSAVQVIVVINVDNGPGTVALDPYLNFISLVQANSGRVMGYVYTEYGTRSPVDVENDITKWGSLYPMLNGIFFDQQPTGDDPTYPLRYKEYASIARATFGNTSIVVTNPGTTPDPVWLDPTIADIEVLYENSSYPAEASIAEYLTFKNPPERAMLVHDLSILDLSKFTMAMRYVKWIYATDDSGSNPWNSLSTLLEGTFMALSGGDPTAIHKTGNETITVDNNGGTKTINNSNTDPLGAAFKTNNSSLSKAYWVDNTSTGVAYYVENTGGGSGFNAQNSGAGTGYYAQNSAGGYGYYVSNTGAGAGMMIGNSSTGTGAIVSNTGTGIGVSVTNSSTGTAVDIENTTAATGLLVKLGKQGVTKVTVDDSGNITSQGKFKAAKYDLSALGVYANDGAAATGGVAIGEAYINTTTKAMTIRTT